MSYIIYYILSSQFRHEIHVKSESLYSCSNLGVSIGYDGLRYETVCIKLCYQSC